jgi:hypothetical protein
MPVGGAACPACGTISVVATPLRIALMLVSAVIAYQTVARTGIREWAFILCFFPLTFFVQAAILRALSTIIPLPLRASPKPFEPQR